MVKPITPQEVTHEIPDFVIKAVNKLIQENWNGKEAVIHLKEILNRICVKENNCTEKMVFSKQWLDFEDIYRKAGWKVDYDQPAYNETDYEPYFTFQKNSSDSEYTIYHEAND